MRAAAAAASMDTRSATYLSSGPGSSVAGPAGAYSTAPSSSSGANSRTLSRPSIATAAAQPSTATAAAQTSSGGAPGSSAGVASNASGSSVGVAIVPSGASAAPPTASQRERSQSLGRSLRPTLIIRPKIIGVPVEREPGIPTHTFISTTISLLLYLAVLVVLLAVDCPFDRDVIYFFAFNLLAFTGSLFTLIINLTAVRHHKFNCASTSLSLLYSGSAALVLFGLVHTGLDGLCKPNYLPRGSVFTSNLLANYCAWVMTSLAVMWQLVAYYYYG